MRSAAFVIAVLSLPVVRPLAAQEPPPVVVGDQVRFWMQQTLGVTQGTITGWAVDSFTVSDTWIPLTSVTRIEVLRGQKTSASTVALATGIGAGIGAAGVGVVWATICGAAYMTGYGDCNFGTLNNRVFKGNSPTWLGFMGIGAGVGGLLGALVGENGKTGRWVPLSLDQLGVGFVPQPDGRFGLGLSVTF